MHNLHAQDAGKKKEDLFHSVFWTKIPCFSQILKIVIVLRNRKSNISLRPAEMAHLSQNKNKTMKFLSYVFIASVFLLASCESTKQNTKDVTLANEQDSVNYALGINVGESLKQLGVTEINEEILTKAINQAFAGDTSLAMNNEEAMQFLNIYFQKMQMQKAQKNLEDGKKFLEENGKNAGVITTASGLQYQVITEGTGASPVDGDQVTVNYTGTLIDGTKFDSSYDKGQPLTYPINKFVPGWTEVLKLMKEGSKYKVWIPSELGYGARGNQGIPGNAVLIFDMELLKVIPAADGNKVPGNN
jgi:FKBP-type peptidyl-prolyl cis-trans isomerase